MIRNIIGFSGGGYNQQQNLDALNVYTGVQTQQLQQLNYAWASVSEFLRESRETPQERAQRLVAEARERHPEWQVKRLAAPLE